MKHDLLTYLSRKHHAVQLARISTLSARRFHDVLVAEPTKYLVSEHFSPRRQLRVLRVVGLPFPVAHLPELAG